MTTEQKNLSKPSSTVNNPVIMVVDEDQQFLENTKKYFLMRGYSIHSVHDVRAILTRIKLYKPNIIIMEANLDDIRCDSVIKMMQKKNINLPIIVTSQRVDKNFINGLKEFKISFCISPIILKYLSCKELKVLIVIYIVGFNSINQFCSRWLRCPCFPFEISRQLNNITTGVWPIY